MPSTKIKRSVSFDGQAIHTTYISPKGAFNFGFSLEGRVLSLTSRAGSTDAAAVELEHYFYLGTNTRE